MRAFLRNMKAQPNETRVTGSDIEITIEDGNIDTLLRGVVVPAKIVGGDSKQYPGQVFMSKIYPCIQLVGGQEVDRGVHVIAPEYAGWKSIGEEISLRLG